MCVCSHMASQITPYCTSKSIPRREAQVSLASLCLVAMSGHPRVSAQSLADFVAQLAGRPCCTLTTLYGFVLTDDNGRRAVYVGADASGCRPDAYLDALRVDRAAASPDVAALPGRLRFLAARGFRLRDTPAWELRGVPPGAETAAALALEGEFGQGFSVGGILALHPGIDVVHDAVQLLRFHDERLCVACGKRGHAVLSATCGATDLSMGDLPFRVQRLRRRLGDAPAPGPAGGAPLLRAGASLAPRAAQAPPAAQAAEAAEAASAAEAPRGGDAAPAGAALANAAAGPAAAPAAPAAALAPARAPGSNVRVPARRARPARRPLSWARALTLLTPFEVRPGVTVVLLADLCCQVHRDDRHCEQTVLRWSDRVAALRSREACWQLEPGTYSGVRGSPPWVLTLACAQALFAGFAA